MKLLHTSDWHLGKTIHEHSLLEDQRHVLGQIIELMERDPHDVMVIAGDVYDRSIPPAEAVRLFSDFLKRLRDLTPMPVLIIPGNHDSSARLSYLSEIITMADIHIRTDVGRVAEPLTLQLDDGPASFFMVPFLSPAAYDVHDEGDEREERTHERAVREAVHRIRAARKDSDLNILVGHLFTRGGLTSDSERRFVGTTGEVDASLLDGFDYVALGHLHRPQSPVPHIHYAGSPLKYSFSEAGDVKRLLSVQVEKGACTVNPINLEPLFDMARVKGTLERLLDDEEYTAFEDHYLEVELTDRGYPINPLQELKKRFPNILSVRMAAPDEEGGGAIPVFSEATDIEEDFSRFHRYIHGDKSPPSKKLRLFQEAVEQERVES
jgi:exonuclease SbcD